LRSYTANGLLPNRFNFSTIFGNHPAQTRGWVMQAQKIGFVAVSPKPTGGTDLPGTSTSS
jgi:hypothetical protein